MKHRIPISLAALGLLLVSTMSTQASASAAQLPETVVVTIDPPSSSVVLGENLDLQVSVTNIGTDPTPPLVVHLDITNPDQATSVDPEDWTPTLSQTIGAVGPGETVTVEWAIQPISAGTFATYAVALSPGVDTIAASNVLSVIVADQRTLNPGGVLPIAVGAPVLIGALLLLQMRLARRTPNPSETRLV